MERILILTKYTRLIPEVAFAVSDPTSDEVGYVSKSSLTKFGVILNRPLLIQS